MKEAMFLIAGFLISFGFGLYRMRDRLGPFVCQALDDTPTVDFYFDPARQNYSYRTYGGATVTVHQVTDGNGNPARTSSATVFE